MANATPTRIGAVNAGQDKWAMFLKIFTGEVLTAFEQATIMMGKHMVRTIPHGKSASFPASGRISAEYHTPGAEILGLAMNHAEQVITLDGVLISHAFLADIDEAMNHYDVRRIYTMEMGRKLAQEMDLNILCEVIKAARASNVVTGLDGGTQIEDADFGSATLATKALALANGLYAAAQALDEKDVQGTRYSIFKPAEYYALVQGIQSGGFSALHKDYGGEGSYAAGTIPRIAGIEIHKHNQLPTTDLTAKTYHGVDAHHTVGVVFTDQAVGTVKLMDLSTQSQYDVRRQGTLMVARYACGHGVLRPECAVELCTDII